MPALIVTATVTPDPDVPRLAVRDPAARLDEYLSALPHHLGVARAIDASVVITENSGADLAPFAQVAEARGWLDRLELLPCDASPGRLGRGYGELRMIQAAFERSSTLRGLEPEALVWKVTGRYRVLNLARLARDAPPADVYCNLRTFSPRQRDLRWIDQWAFAMTRAGFESYVRPVLGLLEQGETSNSETVLAERIYAHRHDPGVVPRFALEPRVSGVAAWDGRSYDRLRTRVFHLGAALARRLVPSLWV
jgi:hypothetical protein